MEPTGTIDRDCPFGTLFQQIINEMKSSTPLWEDFTVKSTKLHSCLRSTIQAITSFLDALQKIADAATNTKGSTKDIGTALTRICLRHKSLEAKMKTFTSSLMDCLILPLQEKMEDWKKSSIQLDKDHSKEYKRSRAELKKRSIETLRLQKKLRKGALHNGGLTGSFSGTLPRNHHGSGSSLGSNGSDSISLHGGNRDLNRILEVALRDTAEKRQTFEDSEKQAIRTALTEERSRFCLFVSYLKPVVDEEVAMLYELTHVQEAMQQLEKHSSDPFTLPPASEQVIADLKGSCDSGAWSFQTPPSSPSSLGSRKSSMCSISSVNSSSSGSAHSPSHKAHRRTLHHPPVMTGPRGGALRYPSVSSQDSGFTSQDALYSRLPVSFSNANAKPGNQSEGSNTSSTASSNSSTPSSPYPPANTQMSTWPNVEDSIQFERAACAIMNERPHTISSAYERGHQRPPLTVYTFQPPDAGTHPTSPSSTPVVTPLVEPQITSIQGGIYQSASEIYGILRGNRSDAKPPVPKRCSSLERPQSMSAGSGGGSCNTPKPLPKNSKSREAKSKVPEECLNSKYASNVPDFNQSSDDMIVPQPVYVNMHELNQMASAKGHRQAEMDLPPPPPELMDASNKAERVESNGKGEGSHTSSGYGSQHQIGAYAGGKHSAAVASNHSSDIYGTTAVEACPPGRQPTTSGSGSSETSSRRNSCGAQEKPPPPIRRNSSISASPSRHSPVPMSPSHQQNNMSSSLTNSSHYHPSPLAQNNISSSTQNSHAFPIYIQNPTYSQNGSVANSNGNSSQGSQDSGETTPHASMENLPPPPAYLIGQSHSGGSLNQITATSEEVNGKRVSVADTIKTLTEKNHHPASPNSMRRSQSLRQTGEEMKEKDVCSGASGNQGGRRGSANNVESSIGKSSRANLIQVLNQKLAQHQTPFSGSSMSASSGQQQQHASAIPHYNYHPSHGQSQPIYQHVPHSHSAHPQQQFSQTQSSQSIYSQVYQSVQQSQPIYQQIIPSSHPSHHHTNPVGSDCPSTGNNNSSPRNPRRFSEELLKTTATFVQNRVLGNKTPPPIVTSKEMFVQTLNAKLSQMRQSPPPNERKNSYPFPQHPHMQQHQPSLNNKPTSFASKLAASVSVHQKGNSVGEISRAFRVRQWISSKTVSDPAVCRESLMDQIRRGTKLKPARAVNDRSAPKINH